MLLQEAAEVERKCLDFLRRNKSIALTKEKGMKVPISGHWPLWHNTNTLDVKIDNCMGRTILSVILSNLLHNGTLHRQIQPCTWLDLTLLSNYWIILDTNWKWQWPLQSFLQQDMPFWGKMNYFWELWARKICLFIDLSGDFFFCQ